MMIVTVEFYDEEQTVIFQKKIYIESDNRSDKKELKDKAIEAFLETLKDE